MHTTEFASFRLHHDGEYDGPMIAIQGDTEVIVTRHTFDKALNFSASELLLEGPNNFNNDRHAVTGGPNWNVIPPESWEKKSIEVMRHDVELCIFLAKSQKITELLEKIDIDEFSFKEIDSALDTATRTLESVVK